MRQQVVAEDLTAETFMAAVAGVRQGRVRVPEVTVAWLVRVARHKPGWSLAARSPGAAQPGRGGGAGRGGGRPVGGVSREATGRS